MINGKLDPQPITGLPKTFVHNTGGYMDIAIDPSYSKNGWIYFAFSHTKGDTADVKAAGMTKVIRGKIKDHDGRKNKHCLRYPIRLKYPEVTVGAAACYLIRWILVVLHRRYGSWNGLTESGKTYG